MPEEYLEIERRWLLRALPEEVYTIPEAFFSVLTTVYVVHDQLLELRIRKKEFVSLKKVTYPVITKLGTGLKRQETPKLNADSDIFEYYLKQGKPFIVADHWEIPLPSGCKLEIKRFLYLDPIYKLVLMEIEFENEGAANRFQETDLPLWLQANIVKEVTDDARYNGKNLAVNGRPNPE